MSKENGPCLLKDRCVSKLEPTILNFKTGKLEPLSEARNHLDQIIPQDSASQGLYALYIETGKTPTEAVTEVLKAHTAIKKS